MVSPGMFQDRLTTLNTVGVYHASGEGYVYEFAVNLETLNYLQTINLLDERKLHVTLEHMQTSTLSWLLFFLCRSHFGDSCNFCSRENDVVVNVYFITGRQHSLLCRALY